jgi:hypothetical protein
MDNWLILQSFYNRLTLTARGHIDAAAGGAFFSLTIISLKQPNSSRRWSPTKGGVMIDSSHVSGVHAIKEADMLHAKMDLLMKRMDALTSEKASMAITTRAMDARMTCEVCGDTMHLGNYCPATQEDVMYMNGNNNGYRPQEGQTWNQSHPYYQGDNQGNIYNPNQPSLKDPVFGQAKIDEGFNKKMIAYNKALESLNVKIDSLSSTLKNQLSFNKNDRNLVGSVSCFGSLCWGWEDSRATRVFL